MRFRDTRSPEGVGEAESQASTIVVFSQAIATVCFFRFCFLVNVLHSKMTTPLLPARYVQTWLDKYVDKVTISLLSKVPWSQQHSASVGFMLNFPFLVYYLSRGMGVNSLELCALFFLINPTSNVSYNEGIELPSHYWCKNYIFHMCFIQCYFIQYLL